MSWFKSFIDDNKYFYEKYGFGRLLFIYFKLFGYLVVVPFINIFLLLKIWWLGLLFLPFSYLSYVIAIRGYDGIYEFLVSFAEGYFFIKDKVSGLFRRKK